MQRPRWHDAILVAVVVATFLGGAWVFWGHHLRAWLGWGPAAQEAPVMPAPPSAGGT